MEHFKLFLLVSSHKFGMDFISCEIQLNCKQQFHVAHSAETPPTNNVMFKPTPLSHVTYLSAEQPWLSVIPITMDISPSPVSLLLHFPFCCLHIFFFNWHCNPCGFWPAKLNVEYSQQGGFYRVPLPAARQTPNLEDQ